jgi:hypothetical protein
LGQTDAGRYLIVFFVNTELPLPDTKRLLQSLSSLNKIKMGCPFFRALLKRLNVFLFN